MLELRDLLHLDCLTVTGKTLGENLDGHRAERLLRRDARLPEQRQSARATKCSARAPIRSDPRAASPCCAATSRRAARWSSTSRCRTRCTSTSVRRASSTTKTPRSRRCWRGAIEPGDVVVIRYEGPRANGMPEMYFATAIIAADPALTSHHARW